MSELSQRLRHLVALNEPEHGGPYQGTAATLCVEAMAEAADEIEALKQWQTEMVAVLYRVSIGMTPEDSRMLADLHERAGEDKR